MPWVGETLNVLLGDGSDHTLSLCFKNILTVQIKNLQHYVAPKILFLDFSLHVKSNILGHQL